MLISLLQPPKLKLTSCDVSCGTCFPASARPLPFITLPSSCSRWRPETSALVATTSRSGRSDEHQKLQKEFEEDDEDEDENYGGVSSRNSFRRREEEKDYDRDPEFAEILGGYFDNPEKAQARVEERIRKKRSKILHTKTGSSLPMKVTFNKFDFSNSYIWLEFYNAPLPNDISLICNAVRSWHIVGRLGGCNSMNMQLSQSPLDKRPSYDAIQGANVTPTTFYNIGDFEVQDNLARIWVDIGTSEPLLLDILINALTHISSDYIGIKQVAFGGSEFENWKENFTSEDAGCSVHKI
ncbi:uncharacterized protein LOC122057190 [Macadamia integrifolia]|uniref:uncharacterized protein LOC122057190 n=1 Tax=Macadamia integrifolia TaxID=60698 RepID=UPI001C4EF7E8|nr:uncharacterized protein LOC122057190 [Macadamia integrifolia]